jgi:hypothetical protein
MNILTFPQLKKRKNIYRTTGRHRRRGRRDDVSSYWKLKEEALDRTVWRTCFGRGYGPVVRQTAE